MDGDLSIKSDLFGNLAYPMFQVPDGTPLKPLQVNPSSLTPFGRQADTNPDMTPHSGGFQINVCNTSATQSHELQSDSVRLSAFTPYTGKLNVWQRCQSAYDNQIGYAGGGCGGGYFADYYLLASFSPSASAGATVTTTEISNAQNPPPNQHTPLPVTLQPHQWVTINVGMTPPTAPGAYTFAFGLAVDGSPDNFAFSSPSILLAPVAQSWTGTACQTPAMKAQIPTSPHAFYLCPAS